MLQSFGKIDYKRICNGGPLTLELSDGLFRGKDSLRKVGLFIRAFVESGCQQIYSLLWDNCRHGSTFPCSLLCQTGRFSGLHKRPREALHVPVGHKQADRVVQFLLKGRRSRFSMYAAC